MLVGYIQNTHGQVDDYADQRQKLNFFIQKHSLRKKCVQADKKLKSIMKSACVKRLIRKISNVGLYLPESKDNFQHCQEKHLNNIDYAFAGNYEISFSRGDE